MNNLSRPNTNHNSSTILHREAFNIGIFVSIAAGIATVVSLYVASTFTEPKAYLFALGTTITSILSVYGASLLQKERLYPALITIVIGILCGAIPIIFLVQGMGLIIAFIVMLVFFSFIISTFSQNYIVPGAIFTFLVGIGLFFLDLQLENTERIELPLLQNAILYIAIGLAILLFYTLFKQYSRFSFQIKVTLGILLTGAIIVATIAYFGLTRTQNIVNSLSQKFETSVTQQTKNQILSSVQSQANTVDQLFAIIKNDLVNIADYRASLETQKNAVSQNTYWDATQRVFQLPDGQYGNSSTDVGSVFLPSTIPLTESILADLNTSMYLDFIAPDFLTSHPEVTSLYYISETGFTIYYPNISLAENVQADFDPRNDIFYTIASPARNPERTPRLTDPYLDPAGQGVIVTFSVPVYTKNGEFKGVIGTDIKVSSVAEIIAGLQLGANDFAFLIDQNGFIVYMPKQGYEVFEIAPNEDIGNLLKKDNIIEADAPLLRFAAQRIVISNASLVEIPISGVNTYIASAILPATNYKLVFFAPANDLNTAIVNSRQDVQNDIDLALQNASFILFGLFIGSLAISLIVGQIITQPIKRLTNTVKQIASGDLNARAKIESQDEAGLLAQSFNQMTDQLNTTLLGLEEKVAERTQELEIISTNNAKRATQFEAIARISSIITSTQTLDKLLPQIVQSISDEFGFYHVGIFLVDVHKEYAVLAASNSEGGKRMLQRNHRLKIGETGIVGFVTRSGIARIALDVGSDAVFFNNPDLPETHSEMALPLHVEEETFGALDVQSKDKNAFSQEDINILSVLADQVGIAIQNARLYQQSSEALEQAEISAAQMIERQWRQFLSRQNIKHYYFDGVEAHQHAPQEKQHHNLAIPLILRGAQIGTLKLSTSDAERIWGEDEIAIAQATAERTALAIDNARLLQDAQKRAAKEKTIANVSAKIGNLISIENILQTTIQELGNTLPDAEIAIQFTEDIDLQ